MYLAPLEGAKQLSPRDYRKEVHMPPQYNRYEEVAENQPKGSLALCRLRGVGRDENQASARKRGATATHTGRPTKRKKKCGRIRFRDAKKAHLSLLGAFEGLKGQAGDALLGTHMDNLVVSCTICRGYHVYSPAEWLRSQVQFAA